MNGPLASDDYDDPRVTDYSIGSQVIYGAFAWSEMEDAHNMARELCTKHQVGFYDVSGRDGILFPDDQGDCTLVRTNSKHERPWWKFW